MNPIDITLNGAGPGSQPMEEDGAQLEYLQMPDGMATFTPPVMPEPEEIEGCDAALSLLEAILAGLNAFDISTGGEAFDLSGLDAANRRLIDQVLGEGEVSIQFQDPDAIRIQESVLAGVWRVQFLDTEGEIIQDLIEIGEIPGVLHSEAFRQAQDHIEIDRNDQAEGLLNAPSLLVELADKVNGYQPGDEPHVINLTLLPHSPEDLTCLDQSLGTGRVTILSRGYGNCRITATATGNVWWVQFFNSTDLIILNTIEVVDVPLVAKASQEDITDSAGRLKEILDTYR